MNKNSRIDKLTRMFIKGAEFCNNVNITCNMVNNIYNKYLSYFNMFNKRANSKTNDEDLKEASYRYMNLKSGCGKDAVNSRFRHIVKTLRPDINLSEDIKQRYIALQVARTCILKYEK